MTLENEYKIFLTNKFKEELENIIYYIKYKLKEPVIADNMYHKIMQKILSLKFMPNRYAKLDLLPNLNLRKLIIKNYIVLYKVYNNTNQVFILHIFHCSQNYFNLL